MYTNSWSKVKCNQKMSNSIQITKGVHQGNVLSPLLFNIFMNDINDDIMESDVPELNNLKISHLLYADDLLLLATSEKGLQQKIDSINNFCSKWGLNINVQKSKVMVFSKNGQAYKNNHAFKCGETIQVPGG